MKFAVLGTGVVGGTIGTKLVQMGQEVCMGSRNGDHPKAAAWISTLGPNATQGTFSRAAAFAEIVFNCTSGMASLEALHKAGVENLRGKILIDVANPLDFSNGMPPTLSVCNTDSLGEHIQRAFPGTYVVKTLNTVNASLMVNPSALAGEHDLFMCGNDARAKATVEEILKGWFGWKSVIDMGDITSARATEMLLPIWLRLWGINQSPLFNFKIVK